MKEEEEAAAGGGGGPPPQEARHGRAPGLRRRGPGRARPHRPGGGAAAGAAEGPGQERPWRRRSPDALGLPLEGDGEDFGFPEPRFLSPIETPSTHTETAEEEGALVLDGLAPGGPGCGGAGTAALASGRRVPRQPGQVCLEGGWEPQPAQPLPSGGI